MLVEIKEEIIYIRKFNDRRFTQIQRWNPDSSLVVDEFAALQFYDKKEFNEINDSLKRTFWWDGLQCSLLMALQRAETSVIDGAIRIILWLELVWS